MAQNDIDNAPMPDFSDPNEKENESEDGLSWTRNVRDVTDFQEFNCTNHGVMIHDHIMSIHAPGFRFCWDKPPYYEVDPLPDSVDHGAPFVSDSSRQSTLNEPCKKLTKDDLNEMSKTVSPEVWRSRRAIVACKEDRRCGQAKCRNCRAPSTVVKPPPRRYNPHAAAAQYMDLPPQSLQEAFTGATQVNVADPTAPILSHPSATCARAKERASDDTSIEAASLAETREFVSGSVFSTMAVVQPQEAPVELRAVSICHTTDAVASTADKISDGECRDLATHQSYETAQLMVVESNKKFNPPETTACNELGVVAEVNIATDKLVDSFPPRAKTKKCAWGHEINGKSSKKRCDYCAHRHAACDLKRPECSSCIRKGVKCTWEHVDARKVWMTFEEAQHAGDLKSKRAQTSKTRGETDLKDFTGPQTLEAGLSTADDRTDETRNNVLGNKLPRQQSLDANWIARTWNVQQDDSLSAPSNLLSEMPPPNVRSMASTSIASPASLQDTPSALISAQPKPVLSSSLTTSLPAKPPAGAAFDKRPRSESTDISAAQTAAKRQKALGPGIFDGSYEKALVKAESSQTQSWSYIHQPSFYDGKEELKRAASVRGEAHVGRRTPQSKVRIPQSVVGRKRFVTEKLGEAWIKPMPIAHSAPSFASKAAMVGSQHDIPVKASHLIANVSTNSSRVIAAIKAPQHNVPRQQGVRWSDALHKLHKDDRLDLYTDPKYLQLDNQHVSSKTFTGSSDFPPAWRKAITLEARLAAARRGQERELIPDTAAQTVSVAYLESDRRKPNSTNDDELMKKREKQEIWLGLSKDKKDDMREKVAALNKHNTSIVSHHILKGLVDIEIDAVRQPTEDEFPTAFKRGSADAAGGFGDVFMGYPGHEMWYDEFDAEGNGFSGKSRDQVDVFPDKWNPLFLAETFNRYPMHGGENIRKQ